MLLTDAGDGPAAAAPGPPSTPPARPADAVAEVRGGLRGTLRLGTLTSVRADRPARAAGRLPPHASAACCCRPPPRPRSPRAWSTRCSNGGSTWPSFRPGPPPAGSAADRPPARSPPGLVLAAHPLAGRGRCRSASWPAWTSSTPRRLRQPHRSRPGLRRGVADPAGHHRDHRHRRRRRLRPPRPGHRPAAAVRPARRRGRRRPAGGRRGPGLAAVPRRARRPRAERGRPGDDRPGPRSSCGPPHSGRRATDEPGFYPPDPLRTPLCPGSGPGFRCLRARETCGRSAGGRGSGFSLSRRGTRDRRRVPAAGQARGGGMGAGFPRPVPAGRPVAVKIAHPELARDPEFRTRFRREVRAAQAVSGAFTAPVVAAGPDDDPPWLATVFVAGPSLSDVIAQAGPLPPEAVWRLAGGLVEALQAVHACGLVHRDLKPGNVLIAADGPRVIDFGIARAMDSTALTASHVVIGTPVFMAPEQARGGLPGTAGDVFSLGSVLAYAATGTAPFNAADPVAMLYRIVHDEPDLSRLAPSLRTMVAGCLAKEPATRPSLGDLLDTIVSASAPHPAASPTAFWPDPLASMIASFQTSPQAGSLSIPGRGQRRRRRCPDHTRARRRQSRKPPARSAPGCPPAGQPEPPGTRRRGTASATRAGTRRRRARTGPRSRRTRTSPTRMPAWRYRCVPWDGTRRRTPSARLRSGSLRPARSGSTTSAMSSLRWEGTRPRRRPTLKQPALPQPTRPVTAVLAIRSADWAATRRRSRLTSKP